MSNLRLEVGKEYRTRNGSKIKVIYKKPVAFTHPYVAVTFEDYSVLLYTKYGQYTNHSQSGWDIIEEWMEPVRVSGWVNVYSDGVGVVYATKEKADRILTGESRIACVYVSGVEGQGPGGDTDE